MTLMVVKQDDYDISAVTVFLKKVIVTLMVVSFSVFAIGCDKLRGQEQIDTQISKEKAEKRLAPEPIPSAELSMLDGCILQSRGKCLYIHGNIDRDTVVRAISLADQFDVKGFVLNSGGGDVEAAMELGRYFRRNEASVEVIGKNTCASACLFLLAGAVYRLLEVDETEDSAHIGVHRTFTTRVSSSTSDSDRDFRQQNDLIKKYLKEMNIPESLLDLMNSVSPTSVKWLTKSEANLYFPSDDPVWADKTYSSAAASYGISKVEYIRRLQRVKQECNKFRTATNKSFSPENMSYLNQLSIEDIKCREDILQGTR
jgi:ATP-dependent protease ClpP protease subunit